MGCTSNFDTADPIEELPVRMAAAAAPERDEEHEACRLREAARAVIFEQVQRFELYARLAFYIV